jgi:type I restriction enzyme, S subunit
MCVEWPTCTIESIASKVAMGPFGSDIKTDNFVASGVPVIRGGNLTSGRFRGEDFVFLTPTKADELGNANAYPGDLVFTHRGTLGQIGIIPNEPYERYVVSQSQMRLACDQTKALPEFVFYFFRSPIGQHALLANTSQTGVPAISRPVTSLKAISLRLPPLGEQRAIAHILGTLDDKIELNRRTSNILVAMARSLYKSWFIDFDPVAFKNRGEWRKGESLPGLPAHLYDLFPDRLVESELGEIPEGWMEGRVADVLQLAYGKSLVASSRKPGSFPVYGSGGVNGFHDAKLVDGPCIVVGRKGTVGSLHWENGACWPIDTVFYVEPIQPLLFCFFLLESQRLSTMNTDAAVPGLNRENVYRLPICISPQIIVEAFMKSAVAFFDQREKLNVETAKLTKLRDTLLPKLISGELRVKDAERFVANAT